MGWHFHEDGQFSTPEQIYNSVGRVVLIPFQCEECDEPPTFMIVCGAAKTSFQECTTHIVEAISRERSFRHEYTVFKLTHEPYEYRSIRSGKLETIRG